MLRDPRAAEGPDRAYEILAGDGITPASTGSEVLLASFRLMAEGRMTPEARAAWDELRMVNRRLFVDFFLYHVDGELELRTARYETMELLRRQLTIDPAAISGVGWDTRPIDLDPVDPPALPDLGPPVFPAAADTVEFDQ